jgi:hypothetical protein
MVIRKLTPAQPYVDIQTGPHYPQPGGILPHIGADCGQVGI